jgi:hypothetical protein
MAACYGRLSVTWCAATVLAPEAPPFPAWAIPTVRSVSLAVAVAVVAMVRSIIVFVTFLASAEPEFEFECVLRESHRVLMAASPALLPKDSFHLLGFFVTMGQAAAAANRGMIEQQQRQSVSAG